MAQNQTIQYLTRVGVFDQGTWSSIHHVVRFDDPKRPPIYPGNAHEKMRSALTDIQYWSGGTGQGGTDIYMAQGLYLKPGDKKPGFKYPRADRHIKNLGWCKNLYMDIDVKPGAYARREDAVRALIQDMVIPYKIPAPTIIVASGSGGIHAYWTLNDIFDQKIFRKMASSLAQIAKNAKIHFDQQCTTDPVHLFRVPWTWNYKDPAYPKQVEIIYDDGKDIDLDRMQTALYAAAPPASTPQSYTSRSPSEFDTNDDLGSDDTTYAPANIDQVAAVCPLIKHTLETNGADLKDNPDWHVMASLSCHVENPNETFHRLSSKHPTYDHDYADNYFTGVQHQHERDGVGPHLCATIAGTFGERFCNACVNRNLGTTPLSIPFKRTNGHAYLPPVNPAPNSADLPTPYYRGTDNLIYKPRVDDGKEHESDILAFEYQITPGSGYLEQGAPFSYHFTTFQGERYVDKTLEMNVVSNQTRLMDTLSGMGLPVKGDRKETMDFLMSYTKLLQSKRGSLTHLPPFGWAVDDGVAGFSYGGMFVSPTGEQRCKAPPEGLTTYAPVGDPIIWRDLANTILTPDRPDLAVMTARAFGAPLVEITGEAGVLVGVYSAESGIGKTSALMLGQAVYARPILMGLTDTNSYVFSRAGDLKHLPLYYDEIKGDEQNAAFCKIVFQLTGGGEKGRSGRSGQAREKKTFETSVDYAANKSMVAEVRERDKGTDASAYRIFEFEGKPTGGDAFVASVGQQFALLKSNYGWVGKEYAQFLGRNRDYLLKQQAYVQERLRLAVAPKRDERFWAAAVTTSYLGAKLAVALGYCHFPVKEMWDFLIAEYLRMRLDMATHSSDYNNEVVLVNVIASYLNAKRPRNLIILDKTNTRGRPVKTEILNRPSRGATEDTWGPFEVQISGDPISIRFTDLGFGQWCKQAGQPKVAICQAMKRLWNARLTTVTIGSGADIPQTAGVMGWDINTATNPALHDAMEEYRSVYAGKFKP